MTEEGISEILKKYKLTDEEHDQYYDIIKRTFTDTQTPVNNPIAVIIGGQTGAGKSSIIGYSTKMFPDQNVVIINSDDIKPFHPKSQEIARLYPELYTKITDQESNTWTSRLFEELRREKYNIIFEGTMKNNRVADEAITELQQLGYTVIVRGLAVCDLESRMSILERYIGQLEKRGFGRLVVPEHHNQTYDGMPNTIDYIEKSGKYDILEIFERGKRLDEPVKFYARHNVATGEKTKKAIEGRDYVSEYTRVYGYKSAKEAIMDGRTAEYDRVIPGLELRVREVINTIERIQVDDVVKQMALDFMVDCGEAIKKKRRELAQASKAVCEVEVEIVLTNTQENVTASAIDTVADDDAR